MTRQFNFPSSIKNACICTVGTQIIRIASKLYMNYLGYPYEIALKTFCLRRKENAYIVEISHVCFRCHPITDFGRYLGLAALCKSLGFMWLHVQGKNKLQVETVSFVNECVGRSFIVWFNSLQDVNRTS